MLDARYLNRVGAKVSKANDKESTPPIELVGTRLLDRYLVEKKLAAGGMSVIFRGQDERLSRPVCVKVFLGLGPERAEYRTIYEHFVQEAFTLSQLRHPNTIRIYDFGYLASEPKSPFFVSEFMDQGTLLDHLRKEGTLSPMEALEILEPVAGALSEAHARGVIHRDIKPSNILFGAAGPKRVVKLADFGIAKSYPGFDEGTIPNRAAQTQTVSGSRISLYSLGWASPEQVRSRRVGPPSDVFSLGLLFAFMLTGKKLLAHLDLVGTVKLFSEGDGYVEKELEALNVPKSISGVIVRACRIDPHARYATVDEFLADASLAVKSLSAPRRSDSTAVREAPTDPSAVQLVNLGEPELLVAGRKVQVVRVDDYVDIGGEDGVAPGPARFRVTFLPSLGSGARVHVKGQNCFLRMKKGRPVGAVDLTGDADLELVAADRSRVDVVHCRFGLQKGESWGFVLQGTALAVPLAQAAEAVLVDLGPGRELILLYRAPAV